MNASTPRQIVLCCDGTNNNLTGGENDTNVVRLCQLLRTHGDEQQLVFLKVIQMNAMIQGQS